MKCEKCRKDLVAPELPFLPPINKLSAEMEYITICGKPYHKQCVPLETIRTKKCTLQDIKTNVAELFEIVNTVVSATSVNYPLITTLSSIVAEHDTYYCKCKQCGRLARRIDLMEGVETKAFQKILFYHAQSKDSPRKVYMFCDKLCDKKFASRLSRILTDIVSKFGQKCKTYESDKDDIIRKYNGLPNYGIMKERAERQFEVRKIIARKLMFSAIQKRTFEWFEENN